VANPTKLSEFLYLAEWCLHYVLIIPDEALYQEVVASRLLKDLTATNYHLLQFVTHIDTPFLKSQKQTLTRNTLNSI
jgi:hypothetical protein